MGPSSRSWSATADGWSPAARCFDAAWGPGEKRETSYLRVYVAQLRRKLERDPAHPAHLLTELGMGYRFRV